MTPHEKEGIAAAITRAKTEINGDIDYGQVPADVPDFSALHDYVDANEYGGLCDVNWKYADVFWKIDGFPNNEMANAVQDALDEWIKAGRP